MKRTVLLFLLLFPALHYLSGQTFQAGFYAGAAISDIPGTDNIDNDVDFEHLGFTVAGTVSAQVTPKTKLQMEIRFFQRGAQQSPQIVNDSASTATVNPSGQYLNSYFTIKLNYVDVVFCVKHSIHFNLRNVSTDKYGIEGGLSVGYLMGYSYEAESINYTLDLAPIDISPFVGIYYNVTPHFYVEGRYSNSINSVFKKDNNPNNLGFYYLYYSSWNNGHNVAFSLTLGFNFGGSPAPTNNSPSSPTDNQ